MLVAQTRVLNRDRAGKGRGLRASPGRGAEGNARTVEAMHRIDAFARERSPDADLRKGHRLVSRGQAQRDQRIEQVDWNTTEEKPTQLAPACGGAVDRYGNSSVLRPAEYSDRGVVGVCQHFADRILNQDRFDQRNAGIQDAEARQVRCPDGYCTSCKIDMLRSELHVGLIALHEDYETLDGNPARPNELGVEWQSNQGVVAQRGGTLYRDGWTEQTAAHRLWQVGVRHARHPKLGIWRESIGGNMQARADGWRQYWSARVEDE